MSFNSIDARLAWRLAPEVVFAPCVLDFGQLAVNVKDLREIYVSNLSGPLQGCAVVCSDDTSWFRIVHVHPIEEGPMGARLKMVVEVDTSTLAADARFSGWIEIHVEQVCARLPVVVATSAERARLRQHTHWLQTFILTVTAIVLVSGGLSLLSSTRATALTTKLLPDFTKLRTWPDRNLVSFAALNGPDLMLHTTAAANAAQQNLAVVGWSPAWSADGAKLAFLAETAGVPQLYLMAAGDQAPIQVTNSVAPKSLPTWSPDGSKVAFLAGPPTQQVLQLLNSHSLLWGSGTPAFRGHDQQVAAVNALMRKREGRAAGAVQRFAWSPDGSKLLFDFYQAAQLHILQVDANGEIAEIAPNSWSPTWSPTGNEIAAVSANGLFRLTLDNKERYYLSRRPAHDPAWSPDGSRIAFLVDKEFANGQTATNQHRQRSLPDGLTDSRQARGLWVIDATGDHEIFLAEDCLTFAWSPDGQRLAYVTGGASDLAAEAAGDTAAQTTAEMAAAPQAALGLYYLWTVVPGSLPVLLAEINSPHIAWKSSP